MDGNRGDAPALDADVMGAHAMRRDDAVAAEDQVEHGGAPPMVGHCWTGGVRGQAAEHEGSVPPSCFDTLKAYHLRMDFEWDVAKSNTTFRERGFGFDYAIRLFAGPTVERLQSLSGAKCA